MGNSLCGSPEPPATRKWKELFKNRQVADKMLKDSGIKVITEYHSGNVRTATLNQFKRCCDRVDSLDQDFLAYVKQYLPDCDIIKLSLREQVTKIQNENVNLTERNRKTKENLENTIKGITAEYHVLEKKYAKLQKYCQETEDRENFRTHPNGHYINPDNYASMEIISKRQQKQIEEQNDLIQYLQKQLSECRAQNSEIINNQTYYDCQNEPSPNQNYAIMYTDNERRESKEQQQLEQKLQKIQQEWHSKIEVRDVQIMKLHQQNEMLQNQISEVQADFGENWFKVDKNYFKDLQQRLVVADNERDTLKSERGNLQQKMQQDNNDYKINIYSLQKVIRERDELITSLYKQNTILEEQKSKYARGGYIDDLKHRLAMGANDQNGLKTQLQQKINQNVEYETMISERDEQISNLTQKYNVLQNQISHFETNFRNSWQKLENEFIARGDSIDELEKRLDKTVHERDTIKSHFENYQQQTVRQNQEYESKIYELQSMLQLQNKSVEDPEMSKLEADFNNILKPRNDSQDLVTEERKKTPENSQGSITQHESYAQIENILENAKSLKDEVEKFYGTREDKTFLHLQELLIRNIVKLDNVETEGNFDIRKRRKEVIQYVQALLNKLKAKV